MHPDTTFLTITPTLTTRFVFDKPGAAADDPDRFVSVLLRAGTPIRLTTRQAHIVLNAQLMLAAGIERFSLNHSDPDALTPN